MNYDRKKERSIQNVLFFLPIYTPHYNLNIILPLITKNKKERICHDDNILWKSNHNKIITQN